MAMRANPTESRALLDAQPALRVLLGLGGSRRASQEGADEISIASEEY